jgi:hypothetical protein
LTYRIFFYRCLFRKTAVEGIEKEKQGRHLTLEEVRLVEISINTKQAIALIWTLFAFGLSLAVALTINNFMTPGTALPWWELVAVFFGLFLIITIPVFLLLALWQITSKSENA